MAKYALDTDFSALKPAQAKQWMCEFREMAEEAFAEQDDRARLLAHLLLLKAYANTVREGLLEQGRTLCPLIPKGLELLTDAWEQTAEPCAFQDFAAALYGCFLAETNGEELEEELEAFYEEHFSEQTYSSDEWLLLEWISSLLLQLTALADIQLDFDFYEDFEDAQELGLFDLMESMLNGFAESYAVLLKTSSFDQVYQTQPFQSAAAFVCDALKAAQSAGPEQALALQRDYSQKLLVPKEHLSEIIGA